MLPAAQDVQYTRAHHHPLNPSPPMYHPHDPLSTSNPAACTYPYASDFHPHPSRHLHSDPSLGSTGSIGPIRTSSFDSIGSMSAQGYPTQQHSHSLYQNPSHAAHTPSHLAYAGTHGGAAHGAIAGWEPNTNTNNGNAARSAGNGSARGQDAPRSSWPVLPALDTNLARQRTSIASIPSGLPAGSAPARAELAAPA